MRPRRTATSSIERVFVSSTRTRLRDGIIAFGAVMRSCSGIEEVHQGPDGRCGGTLYANVICSCARYEPQVRFMSSLVGLRMITDIGPCSHARDGSTR
jgi:hypothetical protein